MWRIGNWLRNLINQLFKAKALNINIEASSQAQTEDLTEEVLGAYGQVLMEILRAISQSNGNAEVIYPLLVANTDKLDTIFAERLRHWVTNYFEEAETDEAESIAAVIFYFGNLIQQFPLGNKASNMEIAVASYETVLKVFTQQAFPQQWAATQNNLAIAYSYRILGDRAENIENAISLYQTILQVYTREAFPQDWATTQNNLANAYSDRIKGDRAENIENAISLYQAALQVYTQQAFPQQWAQTQNNLANAYSDRIKGDRAENIENAISLYQAALQVYTQQAFPLQWVQTQNNLAIAYRDRIKGDKAENIELAIDSYNAALQIRTREAFPQDWAMTQNNLGEAYRNRIKGDIAENIELAISSYKAALQVYTQQAFPQQWATTQNNLANAYSDRIIGDRAENIENAISLYQTILQVYTREAFPQQWATTQNNLANAYSYRIKGDIAENIENAISLYQAVLQVYTHQAFPLQWAQAQNNLANAYWSRIKGDIAENIELAIDFYKAALQIYTREAFPLKWVEIQKGIGLIYKKLNLNISAYITFKSIIEICESLRKQSTSKDVIEFNQESFLNECCCLIIEICIDLKDNSLAIEFIERSKHKELIDKLFYKIKKDIDNLENDLIEKERNHDEINFNNLKNLYEQYEVFKQADIGLTPIRFSEIQKLLDDNTAIIEWYLFKDCFRVFVITCDCEKPIVWHSSQKDYQKLVDYWSNEYLASYYEQQNRWRHELNHKLPQLAEILHLDEVISLIPPSCKKLILIPHRYLHLLPIHALQLSNKEYLIDKFSDGVSYAPSCQLLRVSQQQLSNCKDVEDVMYNVSTLFAIQNPTNDLEFTDIEVETIAAQFNPSHILKHNQATQSNLLQPSNADNLKNANWLHFSCHGYFNLNNPLKSGLQLADTLISPIPSNSESSRFLKLSDDKAIDLEKCLTLENIFELTLSNCRLVSISACESGFTDYTNTSDEYIGLPSGFIRAGAASIVSSLWAVDDFSTAILMIKFYENIQNSNNSMSVALNQAQKWLRQVTQNDLLQWIDDNQNMTVDNKSKIKERLEENYLPQQQPFKQPIFWAAFYAVGD